MNFLPPEVFGSIFSLLAPSKRELDNISLVSKSWCRIERSCRTNLVIPNCLALSPDRLIGRFPELKTLTLKGGPKANDPQLRQFGALAHPWIEALTRTCPGLEEIKLKRMVVDDHSLVLIALHFKKLRSLVLVQCGGFSNHGLAAIASHCSSLEVLDLQENETVEGTNNWLSCFPENFKSLECLNFACLKGEIDLEALEKLVVRCPKLKSLRLSIAVPFDVLSKILVQSPQLLDLGVGSYIQTPDSESHKKMCDALVNCLSIRRLSGFLEAEPACLPAMYPICSNLTFLDVSNLRFRSPHLVKMLILCRNLQQLWVSDAVGTTARHLSIANWIHLTELKVVQSAHSVGLLQSRGDEWLYVVSKGCPKLKYLICNCGRVTDRSLISVAKSCPQITHFELHTPQPKSVKYTTPRTLDEGIRAIVSSCKKLKHLSLSLSLTDQVFLDIAVYAKNLEVLSISYCGESDNGILFALSGCEKLKRLVVRNSPFDDSTLRAAASRYEALQSFSVSSCEITLRACKALARAYPMLNVEITYEEGRTAEDGDYQKVGGVHIYRSIDGARADRPWFIHTL